MMFNTRGRHILFSTSALLLALSVAGCGSAAVRDQTSTKQVTEQKPKVIKSKVTEQKPTAEAPAARARFITRADSICKRLSAEIAAVKPKSQSLREIKRIVPRNVVLEQHALAALLKLEPPPSVRAGWHRMVSLRETLLAELIKLLGSAKKNNELGAKTLSLSKHQSHQSLREAAKAEGFKACGEVG